MDYKKTADSQVAAYNRHDTEAFLTYYDDNAVGINLDDGTTAFKSKEEMRAVYNALFQNPHLHCNVAERIALGNTLVDLEYVTMNENGDVDKAIVVYKFGEDGLIKKTFLSFGI